VDSTALLIRFVYYGDANLDGTVDTIDFNLLAASFSQTGKVWFSGDFNYDGSVDTTDFNLLASNFSQTLSAPALGSLVPEPVTLVPMTMIGLVAHTASQRRRRLSSNRRAIGKP
jgi:dockerin type I repeat protein